jgi:hypothetical protein
MVHGPLGINGEHILFYFGSFEKRFSQIDPLEIYSRYGPFEGRQSCPGALQRVHIWNMFQGSICEKCLKKAKIK